MAIEKNYKTNYKRLYKEKSLNFMHIYRKPCKYFKTTKKGMTSN